jgi:hypothetical protein
VFVSNLVFYSGRFDTLFLISAYCSPRGSRCNLKESEGWTMFLSMLPSNNVFAQHPSTRGMLMKWNSHLNKGTRAKEILLQWHLTIKAQINSHLVFLKYCGPNKICFIVFSCAPSFARHLASDDWTKMAVISLCPMHTSKISVDLISPGDTGPLANYQDVSRLLPQFHDEQ